jgi:hypothetical protein
MAPRKERVYGWRMGLLFFLAGGLFGPLLLFAIDGPQAASYAVYTAIAAGTLVAIVAYALMRRRAGPRMQERES